MPTSAKLPRNARTRAASARTKRKTADGAAAGRAHRREGAHAESVKSVSTPVESPDKHDVRQADTSVKAAGRGKKKGDGGSVKAGRDPDRSKARKVGKVVRDNFAMPAGEYELIGALKKRCRAFGVDVKKSEVLRAGLATIRDLPDERLREVVTALVATRVDEDSKRSKRA